MTRHNPDRPRPWWSSVYRNTVLRYLAVGSASFIIDFSLLYLFFEVLGWLLWIAATVAFLGSFAFNYTIQRAFSFGSEMPHGPALTRYVLLVIVNTILTAAIVSLFGELNDTWAAGKVLATLLTTVANYFAYRYWVFAESFRSGSVERSVGSTGDTVRGAGQRLDDQETT